jgi:hypothetical protein
MNKLITILAIFASVVSEAQSFPESPFIYPALLSKEDATVRLMNRINEYRAENGLNAIPFDTATANGCAYHCNWLSFVEGSDHGEAGAEARKYMVSLNPDQRRDHFKYNTNGHWFAENCMKAPGCAFKDSICSPIAIQMGKSCASGKCDVDAATELVFQSWRLSPGHNKAMLMKTAGSGGCYQYVYFKDGKYRVCATFVIYGNK